MNRRGANSVSLRRNDMNIKELYADEALRISSLMLEAAEEVQEADGAVLVFIHKSVDGDCIGAACAAASIFMSMGVITKVAMPEKLPENMAFLGVDDLLFYPEDFDSEEIMVDGKKVLKVMSVDCTEGDRMGDCGKIYNRFEDAITVDHHEVTELRNDRKWIEPQASSACEMMYYVAHQTAEMLAGELKDIIDERVAACIMAGIVTDTGRFTYTNTRPETLEVAGSLMQLGGDIGKVCYNLFDRKTPAEFMISNTACTRSEILADGKMAICCVSEKMYEEFGATKDDVSDVVSKLRDIDGVEFAVVLRDAGEDSIRANLRSKATFDCSEFAAKYGGGGHKRAAGFTVTGKDLDSLKAEVVAEAAKLL